MLTTLLKKKKKTFLKLNTFSVKKKAITPVDILKKKRQKTSIALSKLYAGDCSWKRGYRKYWHW